MLRLIAITPKRPTIRSDVQGRAVTARMTGFAADMHDAMAKYPPQKPTRYRRTTDLGRGWQIRPYLSPRYVSQVDVFNLISYAKHVQGPRPGKKGARQTAVMHRRGWQSITVESTRIWRKHRPLVIAAIQTS